MYYGECGGFAGAVLCVCLCVCVSLCVRVCESVSKNTKASLQTPCYENEVMRYDKLGSRGLRFDVAPVTNSKSG